MAWLRDPYLKLLSWSHSSAVSMKFIQIIFLILRPSQRPPLDKKFPTLLYSTRQELRTTHALIYEALQCFCYLGLLNGSSCLMYKISSLTNPKIQVEDHQEYVLVSFWIYFFCACSGRRSNVGTKELPVLTTVSCQLLQSGKPRLINLDGPPAH